MVVVLVLVVLYVLSYGVFFWQVGRPDSDWSMLARLLVIYEPLNHYVGSGWIGSDAHDEYLLWCFKQGWEE